MLHPYLLLYLLQTALQPCSITPAPSAAPSPAFTVHGGCSHCLWSAVYFASSSARAAAANTALMKEARTPAFSSSCTPAMVVPPGLVTMSCSVGAASSSHGLDCNGACHNRSRVHPRQHSTTHRTNRAHLERSWVLARLQYHLGAAQHRLRCQLLRNVTGQTRTHTAVCRGQDCRMDMSATIHLVDHTSHGYQPLQKLACQRLYHEKDVCRAATAETGYCAEKLLVHPAW